MRARTGRRGSISLAEKAALFGGGRQSGALGGYVPLIYLPFGDLGAGVVDLAPSRSQGLGTPTFTRATVAWAKLASGLWAQVATGMPRSHYLGQNTAVGAYGGFLAEAAGIQLVTPTASIRDMTNAAWIKVTMTTAKTATGIDGVANSATTLTATGASATILQTLVAAASLRNYSVFLKRRTGTGTVLLRQGATTLDVTALLNSVTYTRVALSSSTLNSAFGIQINTSGDALDADFNQFEVGVVTSPMDAAGAVRALDVLSYPCAGNVDPLRGTAYAEVSTEYAQTINNATAINTAGASTGRVMYVGSAAAATTISMADGTTIVLKTGLSDMNDTVRKRASSWGAGGLTITGDGAAVAAGAFVGAMGVAASFEIGSEAGSRGFNGTIKGVRFFNSQFSDAVLQSITT